MRRKNLYYDVTSQRTTSYSRRQTIILFSPREEAVGSINTRAREKKLNVPHKKRLGKHYIQTKEELEFLEWLIV